MRRLEVRAEWDAEAGVWYVVESDVPGLAAEAETVEGLLDKLRSLVPELVELNRHLLGFEPDPELPVHLLTERIENFAGRG